MFFQGSVKKLNCLFYSVNSEIKIFSKQFILSFFFRLQVMSSGHVLLSLFSFVKQNDTSLSNLWTPAQFEELQLQALSALCIIAPLCINDYMTCQGNNRLLLLLEWCIGQGKTNYLTPFKKHCIHFFHKWRLLHRNETRMLFSRFYLFPTAKLRHDVIFSISFFP